MYISGEALAAYLKGKADNQKVATGDFGAQAQAPIKDLKRESKFMSIVYMIDRVEKEGVVYRQPHATGTTLPLTVEFPLNPRMFVMATENMRSNNTRIPDQNDPEYQDALGLAREQLIEKVGADNVQAIGNEVRHELDIHQGRFFIPKRDGGPV